MNMYILSSTVLQDITNVAAVIFKLPTTFPTKGERFFFHKRLSLASKKKKLLQNADVVK